MPLLDEQRPLCAVRARDYREPSRQTPRKMLHRPEGHPLVLPDRLGWNRHPTRSSVDSLATMLDHILVDVISSIRRAFESARLQRQAVEERFQVDVFLGDVSWETSYSLPGEDTPPRVTADISLDWPTWSQSAYRSWSIGEPHEDAPEVVIEVALRLQRLASAPDIDFLLRALPPHGATIGTASLTRSGPTVEQDYGDYDASSPEAQPTSQFAVEATYQGTYQLDEAVLEDTSVLNDHFGELARWVASILVRLGDLDLTFLPPEPEDEDGDR